MRTPYIALVAAAAMTAPAGAHADKGKGARKTGVVEQDIVRSAPDDGKEISLVDIDNRLGDVEIEGHDKNEIVIVAVKRAPDDETLERLKVTMVTHPNGQVTISTALKTGSREARPIPAGSVGVDLLVRAPRSAAVEATLWNGRIEVESVDNGADLSVNAGSIDVRHASGKIRTKSARGGQQFSELIDATIDAQSVAGDMNVDTVSGDALDASIHDGRFVGRNIRVGRATVRTTRGDITIEGEMLPTGVYKFSSVRGDIELRLSPARARARTAAVKVLAYARRGTVNLPSSFRSREDIETGVVSGSYGTGKESAHVALRSRAGSITVIGFDFDF